MVQSGCDTNQCAWYCVVLYGTMQSIVWYCLISCGVVSERGEGESVTHSQVNEQWHYSAWQPGKMHSGLILLLILSNSWNLPQHGKEWDRLSRSIEVWGFSDALNTWLNTYILLLTPFQKRKRWTAIVITFFVEIRNPHQREVGFFINILNHETQKWLFSPVVHDENIMTMMIN